MTFMEFLQAFKIWGPLGVLAALGVWGNIHQYRNARLDQKAAAAALKAQVDQDRAAADAKDRLHHEQIAELTDRFVALNGAAVAENRELTQQVRQLIEVVSRKRGR